MLPAVKKEYKDNKVSDEGHSKKSLSNHQQAALPSMFYNQS
jgi:hypothetical protein